MQRPCRALVVSYSCRINWPFNLAAGVLCVATYRMLLAAGRESSDSDSEGLLTLRSKDARKDEKVGTGDTNCCLCACAMH